MTKYVLSGPFDYKGKGWGYAHYSYGFALDSFKKVLENNGESVEELLSLPFNKKDVVRLSKSKDIVHISFLPPDAALIIPGAFNVCVFAWEFDRLPTKSVEPNGIFKKDYKTALKQFNAVITLSEYAQKTLKNNGITSHVLPSLTELPTVKPGTSIDNLVCYQLSTENSFYKHSPAKISVKKLLKDVPTNKRFLYIMNPHDIRKNFGNLVTAFQKYIVDNPNAILILKMTVQGDLDALRKIAFGREFPAFPNTLFKNVYFIPEKLSDGELRLLLESFDNYVSPSRAEGQNLPLCEAMLSGRICIAPTHTSMADYVDDTVAITLGSSIWQITKDTHKYKEFWGLNWYDVSEQTILDALYKSDLTDKERNDMIDASQKRIKDFSSLQSVTKKWKQIKDQLKIK